MRYAIRRTIIVIIIILCGHNHHAVHPIDDLSSPPKNHQKTALIANVHEAAATQDTLQANGQKPPNANIWMGGKVFRGKKIFR